MDNDFHLVVATDGSPGSSAAVQWTRSHLSRGHVRMTLLNVIRMSIDDAMHNRYNGLADESERILDEARGELGTTAVEAVSVVGIAPRAIAQYAKDQHANLIVLGHDGHTALGGMGSITFEILHQSEIPVLMVPKTIAQSPEVGDALRIVLAVDGSPEADQAAIWVNAWASQFAAKVSLFSVVDEAAEHYLEAPVGAPNLANPSMQGIAAPAWGMPGVYWLPGVGATLPWQDSVARAHDLAEDTIRRASALLKDCLPDDHAISSGPPAAAIVKHAEDYQADLIVMGRRGHSALGNLLGSVSYSVAQRSAIPLAMVPSVSESGA